MPSSRIVGYSEITQSLGQLAKYPDSAQNPTLPLKTCNGLLATVDLRHNGFMPNRAMEFHDSTFDGWEQDGTSLTLHFSAAYIHESGGDPGVDAGIDWVQEVRLHFANASVAGTMSQLPCYLWDGRISLGDESLQMVPVPLQFSGKVGLKLAENGNEVDGQIEVSATHVELELAGEPKFVENFPGLR